MLMMGVRKGYKRTSVIYKTIKMTTKWVDYQLIPESRRNKLYLYFKKTLQQVGCPDEIVLKTADSMIRDTLKILKLGIEMDV